MYPRSVALAVGGDVTIYSKDAQLSDVYGFNPVSFRLYLRLRPPTMAHNRRPGEVTP